MRNKDSQRVFDELLILRAQDSDSKALELLVKRWHHNFLKYAIRIVREYSLGQDIVQDSWVAIIKNLKKLKNPAHFRPWAYRIIHHKAMDEFRKQKRENRKEEKEDLENKIDDRIEMILLQLNAMEPEDKNIITLFYLEEMPIAEIAFILDIPPGTVKSRLFYCRKKLKKRLNIK